MIFNHRHQKRFRGQSLVEFALVGPIFFIMLLGTVEMGRLMWVNHELSNGTREGARWATVRGERSGENINAGQVRTVILDRTSALNDASLTVNLTWSDPSRAPGSTVIVATTYEYVPMIGGFLGIGNITMNRQSEMTVHY
jgi:Flp pilus assembly protein TadG